MHVAFSTIRSHALRVLTRASSRDPSNPLIDVAELELVLGFNDRGEVLQFLNGFSNMVIVKDEMVYKGTAPQLQEAAVAEATRPLRRRNAIIEAKRGIPTGVVVPAELNLGNSSSSSSSSGSPLQFAVRHILQVI